MRDFTYQGKIFKEGLELMKKKNADYSGKIDNIKATGLQGVITRFFDKACRIISLSENPEKANFESLRDTFIDAMNYANIAIALLDGKW